MVANSNDGEFVRLRGACDVCVLGHACEETLEGCAAQLRRVASSLFSEYKSWASLVASVRPSVNRKKPSPGWSWIHSDL